MFRIFFHFNFFCLPCRIGIQISFILLCSTTLFFIGVYDKDNGTSAYVSFFFLFFFLRLIYSENNLFWRFSRKSTFSRWKESLHIIFMEFSSFKSKGLKFIASLDFYFSFLFVHLENVYTYFFFYSLHI